MKRSERKTLESIGLEWDLLAKQRQKLILDERDISFLKVTKPCIIRNLRKISPKNVLDFGCGTGELTATIAEFTEVCYGIDISVESINLARKSYLSENLSFYHGKIDDFEVIEKIDTVVSNMVFMDDPDFQNSLEHIYNLLAKGGYLLFTITHPCFWSRYRNFQNESWFNYSSETYLDTDFALSLEKNLGKCTHIHRPLSQYINQVLDTGFSLVEIAEPIFEGEIPEDYCVDYPRFLFVMCRK